MNRRDFLTTCAALGVAACGRSPASHGLLGSAEQLVRRDAVVLDGRADPRDDAFELLGLERLCLGLQLLNLGLKLAV